MAKFFISHSSIDKTVVELFKEIVLKEGMGFTDADIIFTSNPETGVPLGSSIPQYIKDNILSCDYVFFMVSENYRKSDICLNEMGAAWALDKIVKPFLLGDVSFSSIGWLYDKNLCAAINNSEHLDELRDELVNKYNTNVKTVVWNRKKEQFLEKISSLKDEKIESQILPSEEPDNSNEELGLLDYREKCEEAVDDFTNHIGIITNECKQLTQLINTKNLELYKNANSYNSAQYSKAIFREIARGMNNLSKKIDENLPIMDKKYSVIVENIKGMIEIHEIGEQLKKAQNKDFENLIDEMESAKSEYINTRKIIKNITPMEQSQIAANKRLADRISDMIKHFDLWINFTRDKLNL